MNDRRVTLNIDRLVLKDVRPEERAALVNSLKQELVPVFGAAETNGSISTSRSIRGMRVAHTQTERGPGPARQIGKHVAQAIGKRVKS